MRRFQVYTAAFAAVFLTAFTVPAAAQQDKQVSASERTAQALDRVRLEPPALRDFLKRMPKGADLHSHLSGAVYAETRIRDAIADGLCVNQGVCQVAACSRRCGTPVGVRRGPGSGVRASQEPAPLQ